jgi:hypothetical protein
VHHPFHEVLDEFQVQTECADAGDVAFEGLTNLVGHEAHLLPLHQFPFGIRGPPFPLGRVPPNLREFFGKFRPALVIDTLSALAKGPVHHQVRITPDG